MDKSAQIVAIIQKVSGKALTPDSAESLFDSGLLDSFALPDMVGEIEKVFSLKIPDSDLTPRKFDTIERIEQYIEEHGN
ncbi:MAG: acyl carrier protein [Acidobacteria bacterium]|nr:acyl carrier protein [Acidobacteriota bacterium]